MLCNSDSSATVQMPESPPTCSHRSGSESPVLGHENEGSSDNEDERRTIGDRVHTPSDDPSKITLSPQRLEAGVEAWDESELLEALRDAFDQDQAEVQTFLANEWPMFPTTTAELISRWNAYQRESVGVRVRIPFDTTGASAFASTEETTGMAMSTDDDSTLPQRHRFETTRALSTSQTQDGPSTSTPQDGPSTSTVYLGSRAHPPLPTSPSPCTQQSDTKPSKPRLTKHASFSALRDLFNAIRRPRARDAPTTDLGSAETARAEGGSADAAQARGTDFTSTVSAEEQRREGAVVRDRDGAWGFPGTSQTW